MSGRPPGRKDGAHAYARGRASTGRGHRTVWSWRSAGRGRGWHRRKDGAFTRAGAHAPVWAGLCESGAEDCRASVCRARQRAGRLKRVEAGGRETTRREGDDAEGGPRREMEAEESRWVRRGGEKLGMRGT